MFLAFALRLIYMLYTHRTWEDGLIMALHSEDFVRGLGLTHPVPVGDGPVQGFTSPMSVLITLIGDVVHLGFGITFLKIVSLFAGSATVWLGAQIALELGLSEVFVLVAALFLALEPHQILWGMAGMETQVLTLVYFFAILMALRGKPWQKGVSLGLAMLGRPDAALLVLLVFLYEGCQARTTKNWRAFPAMMGGLVVLYAPWLIFATAYYGSPVPNTILAKGLGYPSVLAGMRDLSLGAKFVFITHRFLSTLASLGPTYGGNGTGFPMSWDHRIVCFSMLLLILFGLYAAIRHRHVGALLLFAFVLVYSIYLTLAASVVFGWYTVPITAAGVIAAMYGLQAVLSRVRSPNRRHALAVAAAAVYLLALAATLPFNMRSDKYVQRDIETGIRMKMGLYLRDVSYPQDTITSESLGYVGYYSRRVVFDYPGLCSREVVEFLKKNPQHRNMNSVIESLKPSYVVLRGMEMSGFRAAPVSDSYEDVQDFVAGPEVRQEIIGAKYNVDMEFHVLRRKGIPFRPAPPKS